MEEILHMFHLLPSVPSLPYASIPSNCSVKLVPDNLTEWRHMEEMEQMEADGTYGEFLPYVEYMETEERMEGNTYTG